MNLYLLSIGLKPIKEKDYDELLLDKSKLLHKKLLTKKLSKIQNIIP
jgi:hypothetical protein